MTAFLLSVLIYVLAKYNLTFIKVDWLKYIYYHSFLIIQMYFCNFLHLKRAIFPLLVLEIRHILENTKKKHFYLKLDVICTILTGIISLIADTTVPLSPKNNGKGHNLSIIFFKKSEDNFITKRKFTSCYHIKILYRL
jgi:hypothetical protein